MRSNPEEGIIIVPIPINFRESEIGAILTTMTDKKIKVRIGPFSKKRSRVILFREGP